MKYVTHNIEVRFGVEFGAGGHGLMGGNVRMEGVGSPRERRSETSLDHNGRTFRGH